MPFKKLFSACIGSVVLLGLLFPAVSLAQTDENEFPLIEVPDTLEGVREGTEKVGKEVGAGLLISIQNIWHNEIVPTWRAMFFWTNENIWAKFVRPTLYEIGDSIKRVLGQEIEKRKPIIEEKLEKEKQELQQEIKTQTSQATRSLWERFKALLR